MRDDGPCLLRPMHESDVNKTKRELRRVLLAEQDMRLVANEVAAIQEQPSLYSRALEAGLVVIYARAYTEDGRRNRPEVELHRQDADGEIHRRFMDLRDQVYAHADETDARAAVDPFGDYGYAEEWEPLNANDRRLLGELAARQHERLKAERERLQQVLRDAGVDPTPLD
jgi:hypothetical protein